jgi:hypothetical protein
LEILKKLQKKKKGFGKEKSVEPLVPIHVTRVFFALILTSMS